MQQDEEKRTSKREPARRGLAPLTQVSAALILCFGTLLVFQARGLYQWTMKQDVGGVMQDLRRYMQNNWARTAALGLEEPAYVLETAFLRFRGVPEDQLPKRYQTVLAERAERRWLLRRTREFLAAGRGPVPDYLGSADAPAPGGEALAALTPSPAAVPPPAEPASSAVSPASEAAPAATPLAGQEKEAAPTTGPVGKDAGPGVVTSVLATPRPSPYVLRRGAGPRVLLAGDSLMKGIGPLIAKDIISRLQGTARVHARVSSGLSRPEFYNWPRELRKDFKGQSWDYIVIMMGANDNQSFRVKGRVVAYGSDLWVKTYKKRLGDVLDIACTRGARVVWMGLPPMRSRRFDRKTSRLNQWLQEEIGRRECARFLPTHDILGDHRGRYTSYRVVGKKYQKIRMRDGIHMTLAGGRLVSALVLDYLNNEVTPPPGPAVH